LSGCIIDASIIGPLLIPDEAQAEHPALIGVLESGRTVVPSHWHLEVANMGRSAVARKRVAEEAIISGLAAISGYRITVDQDTSAAAWDRTLVLTFAHGLTVYDAAYVELALRLDVPLLCDDADMAKAAGELGIELL
jgi:predicted nucleic acid-binding protein